MLMASLDPHIDVSQLYGVLILVGCIDGAAITGDLNLPCKPHGCLPNHLLGKYLLEVFLENKSTVCTCLSWHLLK